MLQKLRNKKGFTLIELIIVIAILGILALIAIPKLGGYRDSAGKATDEATSKIIKDSISLAIADRSILTVTAKTIYYNGTDFVTTSGGSTEDTWNDAILAKLQQPPKLSPHSDYIQCGIDGLGTVTCTPHAITVP